MILETTQVIFRIFRSANSTGYGLYLLVYVVASHMIINGWEIDDIQIGSTSSSIWELGEPAQSRHGGIV
jgi:hypothetical protein